MDKNVELASVVLANVSRTLFHQTFLLLVVLAVVNPAVGVILQSYYDSLIKCTYAYKLKPTITLYKLQYKKFARCVLGMNVTVPFAKIC